MEFIKTLENLGENKENFVLLLSGLANCFEENLIVSKVDFRNGHGILRNIMSLNEEENLSFSEVNNYYLISSFCNKNIELLKNIIIVSRRNTFYKTYNRGPIKYICDTFLTNNTKNKISVLLLANSFILLKYIKRVLINKCDSKIKDFNLYNKLSKFKNSNDNMNPFILTNYQENFLSGSLYEACKNENTLHTIINFPFKQYKDFKFTTRHVLCVYVYSLNYEDDILSDIYDIFYELNNV